MGRRFLTLNPIRTHYMSHGISRPYRNLIFSRLISKEFVITVSLITTKVSYFIILKALADRKQKSLEERDRSKQEVADLQTQHEQELSALKERYQEKHSSESTKRVSCLAVTFSLRHRFSAYQKQFRTAN